MPQFSEKQFASKKFPFFSFFTNLPAIFLNKTPKIWEYSLAPLHPLPHGSESALHGFRSARHDVTTDLDKLFSTFAPSLWKHPWKNPAFSVVTGIFHPLWARNVERCFPRPPLPCPVWGNQCRKFRHGFVQLQWLRSQRHPSFAVSCVFLVFFFLDSSCLAVRDFSIFWI